ncbi:MAG TPA: extracellular solute-binding protein [Candidatus Binatia bacterium]|jgi:iron(III) transport system substrate-binding protein|nr:extracellular solute-binding protein [Candidatus Binatia bacterium]
MRRKLLGLILGWILMPLLAGPASAAPAWQEEWDRVVQAAKTEGKVSIIGPTGADRRDALTIAFEKKYGISVDYHADSGAGILPRLSAERKADRYLWDVVITGTTTTLENLIPARVLDPLEPALILPEVKDLKLWRNGALEILDPGRQLLVMSPYQRGTLFVNPTLANPKEFKSYKDLLDAKWKGKIVADDPRKSGPGQATFTFFFLHPELGVKFIRALAGQGLTLLRDYAQEVNMLGQGRYSVGIGLSDALAEQRAKQGVPVEIVDIRQLKEGSDTSPASGGLSIFNRAPHPNAAKVYINWLLSKEGQTLYARATGYISNRLDVPTDHTFPWRVPQPGSIKTYTQEAIDKKDDLFPILTEVFGR